MTKKTLYKDEQGKLWLEESKSFNGGLVLTDGLTWITVQEKPDVEAARARHPYETEHGLKLGTAHANRLYETEHGLKLGAAQDSPQFEPGFVSPGNQPKPGFIPPGPQVPLFGGYFPPPSQMEQLVKVGVVELDQ